jgi:Fic family protein
MDLLEKLFISPRITSKEIVEEMKVSPATANTLLSKFESAGIIEERTGNKRNKVYLFKKYIDVLLERKEVKD